MILSTMYEKRSNLCKFLKQKGVDGEPTITP